MAPEILHSAHLAGTGTVSLISKCKFVYTVKWWLMYSAIWLMAWSHLEIKSALYMSIFLRKNGITTPILVMNPEQSSYDIIIDYIVYDYNSVLINSTWL